jgi:xylulose-5-phosphate/fructose-6-phosphate phosphoketolase
VTGHEPSVMHHDMAAALDDTIAAIRAIQHRAREESITGRPGAGQASIRWPMIVLRSPKGWTGPAVVDGRPVEGTWRAHQVPLAQVRTNPEHLRQLEAWMRSYRPEELFDAGGRPRESLLGLVPDGDRRGGREPARERRRAARDLVMPDFRDYAVPAASPGARTPEPTRVLGGMLADVMRLNQPHRNFRLFGPDETASNRLDAVIEVTGKTWEEQVIDLDEHLAADGRVMEILSEHICQGWLEGYLLTGRHGLVSCYEAFIHIVDSMFNQHAK